MLFLVSPVRLAGHYDADGNRAALGYGKWKGGFPGGEAFFKQWLAEGMKGDVPDMPDELQSRTAYEEPEPKVDPREWYADMVPVPEGLTSKPKMSEMLKSAGSAVEAAVDDVAEAASESGAVLAAVATGGVAAAKGVKKVGKKANAATADEAPNPALYEKYYPADKLYIAPNINLYEADQQVSMNMLPVEAGFYERFYPKETLNKAPIIDIFYSGALSTASVSLKMAEVEPLPAVTVVPKGDVQTSLVPSAGGGLKLDFSVSGGERLNAYSDPRSVDKYDAMLRRAASAAPAPVASKAAASVTTGVKKVAAKAAAPAKKGGIKLPNPFAKK